MCYRDRECPYQKGTRVSSALLEIADPLERIFRRLTTYERPISPPPINRTQKILFCIPRENLYNANAMIYLIKPFLKIIFDYAQTHNLMISEHTAVDCSFLELVPTLYREVENQITLHALCDSSPSNQKRSRAGTPPTVHCAGPAVIRIKVKLTCFRF